MAILLCVLGSEQAAAQEAAAPPFPTKEISAGVDVRTGGWAAWGGYTMALGSHLYENGWRARITAGYGNYWFGRELGASFRGEVAFGEILAGYQFGIGPLTAKLFAGAAGAIDGGSGWDQRNDFRTWEGRDWSFKGAAELWLDVGAAAFGQLDLAYETQDQSYGSRLRLGWRMTPRLSLGPEAGLSGGPDYDTTRAGAFVRYEWGSGELSISGGFADDSLDRNEVYGTANLLYRF